MSAVSTALLCFFGYRQLELFNASIEVARKGSEYVSTVERAYLGVQAKHRGRDDGADGGKKWTVNFDIQNYGRTPGMIKAVNAGIGFVPLDGRFQTSQANMLEFPKGVVIAAGDVFHNVKVSCASINNVEERVFKDQGAIMKLVLAGTVTYNDIFGRPMALDFYMTYDPLNERFLVEI